MNAVRCAVVVGGRWKVVGGCGKKKEDAVDVAAGRSFGFWVAKITSVAST